MSLSSLPLVFVNKVKLIGFRVVLFSLLMSLITITHAAVIENLLQLNPKAYSMGNAVSADYVGIDSLQYNPAALVNLKPGFSTEFKLLGAPLAQVVRRTAPTLSSKYPEFLLFYRGYTVRCDSAFRPFAPVGIPNSLFGNPGRGDPVTGGSDGSIPSVNYALPGDVCFGPELANPNGVFLNDPLDSPPSDLNVILPVPLAVPLWLPNIGYKPSEDSRIAFAAQMYSNAPLPSLDLRGSVDLVNALGLQRVTFSPGVAFQVTDKLAVGAALRVSKARLQVGLYADANSQALGFLNSAINDLCKTNESRIDAANTPAGSAEFVYDQLLNCKDLYQLHQDRVDAGLARESGYWPFLPWDPIGELYLQGDTPLIYGWNLGVQWKPMPWITWGATYRTKDDDTYRTKGRVYYSPGAVALFQGLNSVPVLGTIMKALVVDGSASDKLNVDVNVPWPAAFSTGVSMQVFDKTKVNIEYRKYNYSDWESWDATITATDVDLIGLLGIISPNNVGNTIPIPAGGVDTSYYALGIQQQLNKRLALRFGYEDRPFLEPDGFIPVTNIRILSTGTEYKLTQDKVVDLAFSYMRLDATAISTEGESILDDPLSLATSRGAQYRQEQLDVNVVLFFASYTHHF